MRRLLLIALPTFVMACANTIDGSRGARMDAGAVTDIPPGRNADGFDPFRPADVAVSVDAPAPDADPWDLRDATVFDQRTASFSVGLLNGGADPTSYFSASFRLFPRPDDPRCEYTAAGAWSVQRCRQDGTSPRDPHPTPFPHAGELRAVGGTRDLILRPGTNGSYSAQSGAGLIFRDGAVLTLRAAGSAAVPAFSVAAPIPPELRVTSPASLSNVDVSRAQDFVVTWVPITARLVNVTLQFVDTGTPRTSIRIDVQAQADEGRAVIPARVLREILPGEAAPTGSLTIQPTNLVVSRAGAWPLLVTAFGRSVSGSVRLR